MGDSSLKALNETLKAMQTGYIREVFRRRARNIEQLPDGQFKFLADITNNNFFQKFEDEDTGDLSSIPPGIYEFVTTYDPKVPFLPEENLEWYSMGVANAEVDFSWEVA